MMHRPFKRITYPHIKSDLARTAIDFVLKAIARRSKRATPAPNPDPLPIPARSPAKDFAPLVPDPRPPRFIPSNLWICLGQVLVIGMIGQACWVDTARRQPRTATAVVHVCNDRVAVRVDGEVIDVEEQPLSPLVFHLAAGDHELIMSRAGVVLYREGFTLQGGEERVLTAWWRSPAGASE